MGPGRILTAGFMLITGALLALLASAVSLTAWGSYASGAGVLLSSAVVFEVIASLLLLAEGLWKIGRLPGPLKWNFLAAVPGLALAAWAGGRLPGPLGYEVALPGLSGVPALILLVSLARVAHAILDLRLAFRIGEGIRLGFDATLVQLAIVAFMVVFSGAVIVYIAEASSPGSGIKSLGDALWWALATATTVGYGDVVPTTLVGRLAAAGLMVFGIGSLGIFISDMAARIARIVITGDTQGLPVLEREKRRISRMILGIEELTDDELEELLNKIRVLHILARSGSEEMQKLEALIFPLEGDGRGAAEAAT